MIKILIDFLKILLLQTIISLTKIDLVVDDVVLDEADLVTSLNVIFVVEFKHLVINC